MAEIGVTSKLEYAGGSGWIEVPNCKNFNFPQFNVTSVDTTNISIADFAKTFMPGMIDPGSVTGTCEYTDATYGNLNDLVRETLGWRFSDPDPAGTGPSMRVTCDGFLTKLDLKIGADEEIMVEFEIKFTGLPEVS